MKWIYGFGVGNKLFIIKECIYMCNKMREEIRSRRAEYLRKFKELWESISDEKKELFMGGEVAEDDTDRLKIQELKRWYLGEEMYNKFKEYTSKGADDVCGYGHCWCVNECRMCGCLDFWMALGAEDRNLYDGDVQVALDEIAEEE